MMAVLPSTGLTGNAESRLAKPAVPQMSTDYLNRFNEALMLIELVRDDATMLEDLQAWSAIGYRAHFEASALRCAPAAIAAYDRIPPRRRKAFDGVCVAMARLINTVTALLAERRGDPELAVIVEVASDNLRGLIARSTQFINANGTADIESFEGGDLQRQIDAYLRRRRGR